MEHFFRDKNAVHLLGILGAGMRGIAYFCAQRGCQVTGSDVAQINENDVLESMEVLVHHGHSPDHIDASKPDVVVYSAAVSNRNSELLRAKEMGIPTLPRGEFLSALVNHYSDAVVVTGSHGKTSVCGLIAFLLESENLDPAYLFGGRFVENGRSARFSKGNFFISEGDESDKSFLGFQPKIGLILNIDNDHLDRYEHSQHKVADAFLQFASQTTGGLVICGDDKYLNDLQHKLAPYRPLTYGLRAGNAVQATEIAYKPEGAYFNIVRRHGEVIKKNFIPNVHHGSGIKNVLAALCAVEALGLDMKNMIKHLPLYQGMQRRFECTKLRMQDRCVDMVDDYCHHPAEVQACLQAVATRYLGRRMVVVFQSHRYSRMAALMDDFVKVFAGVPVLVLLRTYQASESFLAQGSSQEFYRQLRNSFSIGDLFYLSDNLDLNEALSTLLKDDDVLLMLGAGDIGVLASDLKKKWAL